MEFIALIPLLFVFLFIVYDEIKAYRRRKNLFIPTDGLIDLNDNSIAFDEVVNKGANT